MTEFCFHSVPSANLGIALFIFSTNSSFQCEVIPVKIHALRSAFCIVSMFLGSGIFLIGCGGSSNTPANNTQPSSPAPSASQPAPGAGSGGSTGSGGGSSAGGGNSATSISGTVVNSQTGAPVNGIVAVALEGAVSDFTIRAQTTADAQGHFRFDNVQPSPNGWGWTIGVAARSSDGTLFAPTLLISHNHALGSTGDAIEPGIDVGIITLTPSPKGTLRGNVFSQDAAGMPQSVNVIIDPLNTFVLDRHFSVPWIDGAPKLTTNPGDSACGTQSDACSQYALTVPTANVWLAMYDHSGNQFSRSSTPQDYSAIFSATSTTTGAADCNPSSISQFFGGFGGNSEIVANSQPHFQGCTP